MSNQEWANQESKPSMPPIPTDVSSGVDQTANIAANQNSDPASELNSGMSPDMPPALDFPSSLDTSPNRDTLPNLDESAVSASSLNTSQNTQNIQQSSQSIPPDMPLGMPSLPNQSQHNHINQNQNQNQNQSPIHTQNQWQNPQQNSHSHNNHLPNSHSQQTAQNPYQAPSSLQQQDYDEYYEENDSTWYSMQGRIGRLRYMSYSFFIIMIMYFAMMILAGVLAALGAGEGLLMFVIFIVIVPFSIFNSFIYPIRRLHDLGHSGWFCLLNFIPVINLVLFLYLAFAPGHEGANDYGNPPRENQWYHWAGAVVVPMIGIAMIGVLAAVAIPAYQDYVERAKVQQEQSMQEWQDNADE